jgi:hypothetical protein
MLEEKEIQELRELTAELRELKQSIEQNKDVVDRYAFLRDRVIVSMADVLKAIGKDRARNATILFQFLEGKEFPINQTEAGRPPMNFWANDVLEAFLQLENLVAPDSKVTRRQRQPA